MKLLREMTSMQDLEILVEDNKSGGCKSEKVYKIKGPFLAGNVRNKNERLYPTNVLNKAVKVYDEEYIQRKRSLGALDHSATPTVELNTVSHIVESLVMDGDTGVGCAKILTDLPNGRIAKTFIDNGVLLGVSSRSVGNVGDKGIVQDDLVICSVDLVLSPSGPNCYVESIVENKEWIIQGDKFVEVAVNNLQNKVDKKYNSSVVLQYMTEFLNDLKLGNKLLK